MKKKSLSIYALVRLRSRLQAPNGTTSKIAYQIIPSNYRVIPR